LCVIKVHQVRIVAQQLLLLLLLLKESHHAGGTACTTVQDLLGCDGPLPTVTSPEQTSPVHSLPLFDLQNCRLRW